MPYGRRRLLILSRSNKAAICAIVAALFLPEIALAQFKMPDQKPARTHTNAPLTSGGAILKGNGSGGFANAISGTDYAPPTSGSAPLFGNGSGGFTTGSISGTGSKLMTGSGSYTAGHIAAFDPNHNVVDGGAPITEINLCTVSGTSAGSAQCYQHVFGHRETTLCYVNGYENTTSTPQTCSFASNGGSAYSSIGVITSNISPFAATLTGSPPSSITLPSSMNTTESGLIVVDGL